MAVEHQNSRPTSLILVSFCLISRSEVVQGQGRPQFLALIVLGDSTLDTGNNNNINTPGKCNFLPYDRDFPGRIPTECFSNGKLTSDFLGIISKYSTFIFLYTFQRLIIFLSLISVYFELQLRPWVSKNNPCIPRPTIDVG